MPELVRVPAGTIDLRDARSGSVKAVSLEPFEIGRTPVTWAEFAAVWPTVGPGPDTPPDQPAHGLSWFDAVDWCNRASELVGLRPAYRRSGRTVNWNPAADGYRLPTEAEWEFACRAGSTGPGYGPLHDVAWTAADGLAGPARVARKLPNRFGLYDTLGNVWEWCWDYADPARYSDYRSVRGGGWADHAWHVRASVRRSSAPEVSLEDLGFRVACGPAAAEGDAAAQGWSAAADLDRAKIKGPLPVGWTPLRVAEWTAARH